VTTTDQLRKAQERVAEQRERALAARPTGKPGPGASRRRPLLTAHDERSSALATAPPLSKLLLSRADLNALGISYSRPHLHRLVAEGRFPAPVAFGPEPYARKAWRAADVEAWLAALPYTIAEDGEAPE
jgi:predicted DNA-binding transcriptional regulator AlpA